MINTIPMNVLKGNRSQKVNGAGYQTVGIINVDKYNKMI
jgi:hypothetical protein